ncbi:MAG: hypothetical protein JSW51_14820 [Gemmatimonadota bacterium]|nr:MAG: hypothetical protein JSW51_14820 [Gemmatimonadota bacterium]
MRLVSCLVLTATVVAGCSRSDLVPDEGASSPEQQQVVAVVEQLFHGIATQDTILLGRLLDRDAQLVSVREVNGEPSWTRRNRADFLSGIGTNEVEMVERMWDPEVRVDGDIASLWAPYDFHVDGEFSHCGYDAFHLVRKRGVWLITAITYTVRTEGCHDALPPPPDGE